MCFPYATYAAFGSRSASDFWWMEKKNEEEAKSMINSLFVFENEIFFRKKKFQTKPTSMQLAQKAMIRCGIARCASHAASIRMFIFGVFSFLFQCLMHRACHILVRTHIIMCRSRGGKPAVRYYEWYLLLSCILTMSNGIESWHARRSMRREPTKWSNRLTDLTSWTHKEEVSKHAWACRSCSARGAFEGFWFSSRFSSSNAFASVASL